MQTQFCNYMLKQVLCLGGLTITYLAANAQGESVVVKVLPSPQSKDASAQKIFTEMAMTRPSHPNIIPILDVGECDEALYFAEPYIAGCSLQSLLARMKILTAEQFVPILKDVCVALDAAHIQGFIHCDVNPNNILIRAKDGRAFLNDFKSAVRVNAPELSGKPKRLVGNPGYMSPEQLSEQRISPASDVYSLGVIAYEALSGQLPFNPDDPMSFMHMRIRDIPPDLRSCNPNIQAGVAKAVMRALNKEPVKRYSHAKDFAQTFVRALQNPTGWLSWLTN